MTKPRRFRMPKVRRWSMAEVIDEATRRPGSVPHVARPRPPRLVAGRHPREVLAEARRRAAAARDPLGRRVRRDAPVLASWVVSYPETWEEVRRDAEARARFLRWLRSTIRFLRCETGGRLASILLHIDEPRPHLHAVGAAALVPDTDREGRPFERISLGPLDPARTARDEAHRRAAAEGRQAKKAEVDQAARRALEDLHHRFHRDVGAFVGLGPVGAEAGGRARTDAITHAASRGGQAEVERLRAENDRLRSERLIEDRLLVSLVAAATSVDAASGAGSDPRGERAVAISRRGLAAVREAARSRMGDVAERGILLPDGSVQLADAAARADAGRIRLSVLRSVEDARADDAAIAYLGSALAARERVLAEALAERDRAVADLEDQRTASKGMAQHLAAASDLLGIAHVLREQFPEVARILDGAAEQIDDLRRRPSGDELAVSAAEADAARSTLDAIATAPTAAGLCRALESFAPAAASVVRRLEAERAEALTRPTAADLEAERERARASAERAQRAEARANALEANAAPAAALAAADAEARIGNPTKAAAVLGDVAPSLSAALLSLAGRPESGDRALAATMRLVEAARSAGEDLALDEAGRLRVDSLTRVTRDRVAGTEALAGLIVAHDEALRRPVSFDAALGDTVVFLQGLLDQGYTLRLGPDDLLDTTHLSAEVPELLAGRQRGAAALVALDEALARPTSEDLRMASEDAASKARTQAEIEFAGPLTAALSDLGIAWNGSPFEAAAEQLRREREEVNTLGGSLRTVTADRDRAMEQWSAWSKAAEDDRARVTAAAERGGLPIEANWEWRQILEAVDRHLSRQRPAPPPNGGLMATALDGLVAWSAASLGPPAADLVTQVVGRLRTAASGSALDWSGIRVPAALGPPVPVIVHPLPPPPTERVALAVLEAAARRSASLDHRETISMVASPDSPTARAVLAAKEWARANPRELQMPDLRAAAARRIGAETMPEASRARAERIGAISAEQARRASLDHRDARARQLQRAPFSPRTTATVPAQQRKSPSATRGPER